MEDLTPQERAAVVAVEAWAWGSSDVSEEEAEEHLAALSPEEWERVEAVLRSTVEASRARQRAAEDRLRAIEDRLARLEEWT
jgi:hypothetical protein